LKEYFASSGKSAQFFSPVIPREGVERLVKATRIALEKAQQVIPREGVETSFALWTEASV
jgi:hypothetical protein